MKGLKILLESGGFKINSIRNFGYLTEKEIINNITKYLKIKAPAFIITQLTKISYLIFQILNRLNMGLENELYLTKKI